jgi:apocytochrome f
LPIYLGANRGRGQVYPDGAKSNNTVYTSSSTGVVKEIATIGGGFQITLVTEDGTQVVENVPPGPKLLVEVGKKIKANDPITNNPNVGGFGQAEAEIVLQDPARVQGLLVFFRTVFVTQVFLVLKKKQFEKVQLTEMNFLNFMRFKFYF